MLESFKLLLTHLHSSGRSPSGSVEDVGLPMMAEDAALEVWEWPAGTAVFFTGSLEVTPLAGTAGAAVDGPATLNLLNCPLDTARRFASSPIWWVSSTILSLLSSALLLGRADDALMASAANFFRSISANSLSADFINNSHLDIQSV